MKIALPSRNKQIDSHFGHCEYFTVYTVDRDNKTIVSEELIESPAGCGCKSNIASVLSEKGVKLMLAGNMGDGAVRVLAHNGIEVIRGCAGLVSEVANHWLNGTLEDSGISCDAHSHGHECNH